MAGGVEESTLKVDGVEVFLRRVAGEGPPTVYCHGNPTHSEDWLPFLRRGGAAIAIDMPGWGRSARPDPARFDYTMHGLSAFLGRCLDELGVAEHNLVVHDWGALALIGAQARPERVKKLVVIDAVPLLPGYRWHWIARYIWRRRGVGELFNRLTTRSGIDLLMRQARGDRSRMPARFIDLVWDHWNAGTGAAVLALYRDADPDRLAAAGKDLGGLSCPALVLWGELDVYLPTRFAHDYGRALPSATTEIVAGAGHWPWIDDPTTIDHVLSFLA